MDMKTARRSLVTMLGCAALLQAVVGPAEAQLAVAS
jgi:hypothetical protein